MACSPPVPALAGWSLLASTGRLTDRYYAGPLIPSTGRCWYASFPSRSTVSLWRRQPMTTAATHQEQGNTTEATLLVAFELRETTWKLGFPTGPGHKPRERTVTARHHEHVLKEIAQANRRFG